MTPRDCSGTLCAVRSSVVLPLGLTLLAGCRVGFDRVPEAPDGPGGGPDGPPPHLLSCGSPLQFTITNPAGSGSGSGTVVETLVLAATAAADDYYVFAEAAGEVHGFSYGFAGDQLVTHAVDAPVFSGASGTIAAVPAGDGVLASIVYGQPSALGTALVPLDGQLAPRGMPQMYAAWFGGERTIARADDGALAFLGATSDVAAKLVGSDGASLGSPHTVIDRSESPTEPTITASGAGFLVTWSAAAASPDEVHAELLDKQLATAAVMSTTINPAAMYDGHSPRAAYAPAPDRYLFAWWLKTPVSDEVWVSLRDGGLGEIRPILLSPHAKFPRLAAGQDDFLVVWQDTGATSGLAAARVKFDGTVQPLTVSGAGGSQLGWDVVTRAGQPALIWIEGGATTTMWLDPLCN